MTKKDIISSALGLLFAAGLIFWALSNRQFLTDISAKAAAAGLFGVFLVSAIAASIFSVTLIPIPYFIPVVLLSDILSAKWGILGPVAVGAVSAFGGTLGQMPTFVVGYSGSNFSKRILERFNERSYQKVLAWVKKHGLIAVFMVSAVPNPLHLPITLTLGILKFPPFKWLVSTLIGNLVKNLLIAFAGYLLISYFV